MLFYCHGADKTRPLYVSKAQFVGFPVVPLSPYPGMNSNALCTLYFILNIICSVSVVQKALLYVSIQNRIVFMCVKVCLFSTSIVNII